MYRNRPVLQIMIYPTITTHSGSTEVGEDSQKKGGKRGSVIR